MHALIQKFVEHPLFGKSIMALIIINAIILGLETVPALMLSHGAILIWLDKIILKIFVIEIILRLYVYRGSFFKDPWNLFDFAIVTLTLIPASGQLSILRAFRILRALRLITIIPALKRVVGALLASIPGLGAIGGLLMILFYVFAVMATKLFGSDFPDFFGSIAKSMYTLFEVMTLEGWSSGIVRPVMEIYPWAWAFFIPFILISAFAVLNLFLALIVDSLQAIKDQEKQEILAATQKITQSQTDEVIREIEELEQKILDLKQKLKS